MQNSKINYFHWEWEVRADALVTIGVIITTFKLMKNSVLMETGVAINWNGLRTYVWSHCY